jgi:endonuclease III
MTRAQKILARLLERYPEPRIALEYRTPLEEALMQAFPRKDWVRLSNALILHGRETCTARKPRCGECILRDLCPWPTKTATA